MEGRSCGVTLDDDDSRYLCISISFGLWQSRIVSINEIQSNIYIASGSGSFVLPTLKFKIDTGEPRYENPQNFYNPLIFNN